MTKGKHSDYVLIKLSVYRRKINMRKILLLALLGILSLSLFGCYEKNNLYKELDTEKAETVW